MPLSKAVLRGKLMATRAYLKKQEKHQINDITLHLKQREKEEMKNPTGRRRKENKSSDRKKWKKRKQTIAKPLLYINHSRILYDTPPRVMEIQAKLNNLDLIKLKSFCTTKETMSKLKRQPSEWVKIIANEATDKELISKVYKHIVMVFIFLAYFTLYNGLQFHPSH